MIKLKHRHEQIISRLSANEAAMNDKWNIREGIIKPKKLRTSGNKGAAESKKNVTMNIQRLKSPISL